MCGIYGYVGEPAPVVSMVATALRTMEYRGYDSWGIGWDDGTGLQSQKQTGRVPALLAEPALSTLAIGHTRWATHGGVTASNAHPHVHPGLQVAVVHNGVIENVVDLRGSLAPDVALLSETDSEIVVHLVEAELQAGAILEDAVERVFHKLSGSNAIVVAHRPTQTICAITSRSPLRLGRRDGAFHLASDPLALVDVADEMAIVPDGTLVTIRPDGLTLRHVASGNVVPPNWTGIPREIRADLGDFPHFTLKEIHDQVEVIQRLASLEGDVVALAASIRTHRHLLLTGCGSALYAASLGAEWLREWLPDTWVDVVAASEIEPATRNLGRGTLVVALTQSGETADVVDALHTAKAWGSTTATLVNVESSTVATMVDYVVPLKAGTERSVLATKSFMAMVVRMLQLVADVSGMSGAEMGSDLHRAVGEIRNWLHRDTLHDVARRIQGYDHVLTLGKGVGHKVALEAALKIKEGSYSHAEAFLTGELKHGPLALVTEGTPALLFATTPREIEVARIASHEITSRGGATIGVGAFDNDDCSEVLHVPDLGMATPLVHVVIAQRIAYLVAVARGVDPDYPRNLAKSVTVR